VLQSVSLKIFTGDVLHLKGRTGSGKSTLLQTLLGETYPTRKIYTKGNLDVAYVSQTAWIRNATLKENILFFRPFDKDAYQMALHVADLTKDLEQLEDGDQTEIGEKGLTLSGGQKMRVAVARAVYGSTTLLVKLYLFDDIFAALDGGTALRVARRLLRFVANSDSVLFFAGNLCGSVLKRARATTSSTDELFKSRSGSPSGTTKTSYS
ncbi:unnamed protein product, partial [Amoebophrya sp. A25]